ncbi:MAG: DUF1684 domain-containing protein [Vicinamibacterales bacterium]
MPRHSLARRASLMIVVAGVAVACGRPAPVAEAPPTPEAHAAQVQAWRDQHEADYRRDWVSIAGLHILAPGTVAVGSAPANPINVPGLPAEAGRLTMAGDRVTFDPAPGVEVRRGDEVLAGPVVLKAAGEAPADEIHIGEVRLNVHETGQRLSLRVRDPNGPLARGFLGFTWFPIDPAYRVVGTFVRDASPKQMKVLNTFDDIDEYKTEGVVTFTLQGRSLSLRPFTTRPNRFYFVFRDASAGHETYGTARFFYADLRPDGTAVLDFNEAYNPPCAFNPYTTCPIPLPENVLPVKILAGEKAYPVEVTFPGHGG